MTAVAPPPNFPNIARQGWNGSNGAAPGAPPIGNDDYRQMFMPRKSVQRANSSSSLASQASASSSATLLAPPPQTQPQTPLQPQSLPQPLAIPNGPGLLPNGLSPPTPDAYQARTKKAPRGLWPQGKTEPVSGITTARPQSVASASSGPSATSAMTALHTPAPMLPSQNPGVAQPTQNGAPRPQSQETSAILYLIPLNATFNRKTINVPFYPDVLRIGRQTNNKTIPTPQNGYFDSKVLSRQHAEIWADRSGKIWIRDVKSSNGTFVNGRRLSPENQDSEPHELRKQDNLELGIDIVSEDQKTIVHHKVAALVEHAGIYSNAGSNMMDLNFGELEGQQMANLGPGGQQQMANLRGRTPGQGAMNQGRIQGPPGAMQNNAGQMQQPRHPNFWLQPITMEQVVKKLNAELRAAKQQSQQLQQTHQYINSILSTDPKKEPVKPAVNSQKVSPIKDLKARFSEPPAPPPQQPLPEKPDGPSLRRSDTERPPSHGSPVRSDSKIASLADALSSARKEIENQSVRMRDLETLLNEERRAREEAEERANRLERESIKESDQSEPVPVVADDGPSESAPESEPDEESKVQPSADDATTRLQQRLELMMSEMGEIKQQMERYRQRAEDAEAESATHRKTLAEMVEKIRDDSAKKARQAAKRRSRSDSDLTRASARQALDGFEDSNDVEEGEIPIVNEKDLVAGPDGLLLQPNGAQKEQSSSHEASAKLPETIQTLSARQTRNDLVMRNGAPAVSILTVVALGVAVMAWLNSYPKVER